MHTYLIEARIPSDLPVYVVPPTGEKVGPVPLFGLVKADFTGRHMNPCDEGCKVEVRDLLEKQGLSLRDVCARAPRAPRPPGPVEDPRPSLTEAGITPELVAAATRRQLIAKAMPDAMLGPASVDIIARRLGAPEDRVLVSWTADTWAITAGKQTPRGIRALAEMLGPSARDVVDFAPLIESDPEKQRQATLALQRLATVTQTGELERDGSTWPVLIGAQTDVLVAGAQSLERMPAHYVLAPMAAVLPSNNPETFSASLGYPPELQERDYARDQLERAKVIRNADTWEPALVFNSNPDAVNGPPITDADGRVLGGNSRTMSTMRYAARHPERYAEALRKALKDHCAAFGLDTVNMPLPELAKMMLVRVVIGQVDSRTISRALNRALTLDLGRGASSVTMGKLIPVEVLRDLAADASDSTLREILRSNSRSIISALQRSGFVTPQNQPQYVTRTGELTTKALGDIEDALTGLVVQSNEVYNLLPPRLLSVLQRVAPALLALEGTPYADELPAARAALVDAAAWSDKNPQQLGDLVRQTGLFAGEMPEALRNVRVARWALWWLQALRAPAVAGRAMQQMVALAHRGPDMFGGGGRDEPEMLRTLMMQPFEIEPTLEQDWTVYVRAGLPWEGLKAGRTVNPASYPDRGPASTYGGRDPLGDVPMREKRARTIEILRGVGGWAEGSDDIAVAQFGAALRALAAELMLQQRGLRAGLSETDLLFAHLYWSAYPPHDDDKFSDGLLRATQAAIELAHSQNVERARALLQPERKPNPLPGWAETLIQVARLVTALSAAGSAGVAINRAALDVDTTLVDTGTDAEPPQRP